MMSVEVPFDGGPAFPGLLSDGGGLNILAEAMVGLEGTPWELAAAMSYEYADAMLAARERKPE